jgi:hypothetical protein
MESPLNKKIQRSLERTAAKKKKDSNYVPVLTLRQQVLSLVTEANKSAQSERQVTPRSALIVMDRALASLAVVDEESRDFAVLREVSSFISTAQKTSVMTASAHTDLLPQGHPLSALNASLTPEEYRFKYAQWLAADADVSSAARPLVAAAFSAKPGSIERDHAFMRLSVTTENVPGYFKLDPAPIIAAFSDGNSSAARRARVALQWRDKRGRWVEMGRGANFRFRLHLVVESRLRLAFTLVFDQSNLEKITLQVLFKFQETRISQMEFTLYAHQTRRHTLHAFHLKLLRKLELRQVQLQASQCLVFLHKMRF